MVFDFGTKGLNKFYAIFTIVILAPWAFVGFDAVSFDTAYFRFPLNKTRRILAASIVVAGLVYIAMAVSVQVLYAGYQYASLSVYSHHC